MCAPHCPQHWHLSSRWKQSRSKRGQIRHPVQARACTGLVPYSIQSSRPLLICCLQECQEGSLQTHSDVVPGISQLRPPQLHIPPGSSNLHPSGMLPHRARGARVGTRCGPGCMVGCHGKLARVPGSLKLLTQPCFGNKEGCACTSQVESKFLTAPLPVLLVLKPAKGTHLPGIRLKVWHIPHVG